MKLKTQSYSNYGMANTPDLLPTVTTLERFKVRIESQQRKPIETDQWPS